MCVCVYTDCLGQRERLSCVSLRAFRHVHMRAPMPHRTVNVHRLTDPDADPNPTQPNPAQTLDQSRHTCTLTTAIAAGRRAAAARPLDAATATRPTSRRRDDDMLLLSVYVCVYAVVAVGFWSVDWAGRMKGVNNRSMTGLDVCCWRWDEGARSRTDPPPKPTRPAISHRFDRTAWGFGRPCALALADRSMHCMHTRESRPRPHHFSPPPRLCLVVLFGICWPLASCCCSHVCSCWMLLCVRPPHQSIDPSQAGRHPNQGQIGMAAALPAVGCD